MINSVLFCTFTGCAITFLSSSKILLSPQKETFNPLSIHSPFPSPPGPLQATIYFLSPRIYLFWIFHINEIIQYMVSCVWLLSLSIMFSRFIYVLVCIITSFLFIDEYYSFIRLYRYTTFVYQFLLSIFLEEESYSDYVYLFEKIPNYLLN